MIGTPVRKAAPRVQKLGEEEQTTVREQRTPKLYLTIRKETLQTEIPSLQLSAKRMEEDNPESPPLIPLCFSVLQWAKEISLTNHFVDLYNNRNEAIRQLFVLV